MKTIRTSGVGLVALALLGVAACTKKEEAPPPPVVAAPVAPPAAIVSTIETGKHLGPNRRVADATTVFGPKDTMYLSVVSENSTPTTSMIAKWTYQTGQLVDSTMQMVARTDTTNPAAVTEFHIVKPKGWPVGKYKVELWMNGVSAGSRDLEVKK